ncbi:non-homologous end-joining factor 1-like [Gigantopelta aegis]|uniref:non-homologous end-joining factor 1-like n=1 Tax=Gigantopelta aegis TaxID=1735272 RepID=UPI001B88AA16|nr:non-homologous end-joining factor 1-like [Gigantopelta aegis]
MSREIQWRRKWHPDLKACPWQALEAGGQNFLVKTKFSNDSCEIMITDLVSFWYEHLPETTLRKRIQELNPSVEAPLTKILDHIKLTVERPPRGTTHITEHTPGGDHREGEGPRFLLRIGSQLAGMPFTWNFVCRPVTDLVASDHLTKPLMTMVSELTRRQAELEKIILLKDTEIEDYISQGARPSRKHYKTVPYDEVAFFNSMLDSKDFEEQVKKMGEVAFNDANRELYRHIMTKHAWLNWSPTKGKAPQSLDDDESLNAGVNTGSSIPSWTNRIPPSVISSGESSPASSPTKSPSKSPVSAGSRTPDDSPVKNVELIRRQALERRLEQDAKKQEKPKKKKKMAF